jgi:hypothetical protein
MYILLSGKKTGRAIKADRSGMESSNRESG